MSTDVADVDPVHRAALTTCTTKKAMIRYACDQLGRPTTDQVRTWLERYGVETSRSSTSTVVNGWRKERGLSDTGDLPALTEEVLTELDAARDVTPNVSSPQVKRVANADGDVVTNASDAKRTRPVPGPSGAWGFYLVSLLSLAVSVNTSWHFFGDRLHIDNVLERGVMFAVVEAGLIACGFGMAANVREHGRPGAPRFFAWALAGLAGYMALVLSGPVEGIARVALGPVLGLISLHLALGIEIRARHERATTWSRIGRELCERFLSRLGLANDERDAVQRTRDRAARRVARLSLGGRVPFRQARLSRALRTSNVAHDPAQRARMLAELATVRHARQLATLEQESPWT